MRRLRGQVVALSPRGDQWWLTIDPQHRSYAVRVAVTQTTFDDMAKVRAPDEILGAWVTLEPDASEPARMRWQAVEFDDGMMFPTTSLA